MELLIASALGMVILGGALTLVRQGAQMNSMMSEKLEMQQSARVAVNLISRDLSWAGTGLQLGGVGLPAGNGAQTARFGCDFTSCYVGNNTFSDDRLYGVLPGDGKGPVVNGIATDMVTIAYRDLDSKLDQENLVSISSDGTQLQVTAGSAAEAAKLKPGDVLVVSNLIGYAAAVVTSVSGTTINLAAGDPLQMNQPTAEVGMVASLVDEDDNYPPSRAFRVELVTYFVDPNTRQLMRQVSAHPPAAVAENVEDLQLTYDVFDETGATASAALADAGGTPNQIRKANVFLRVSAPNRALFSNDKQEVSLRTSVSTRNLTFRDRYE